MKALYTFLLFFIFISAYGNKYYLNPIAGDINNPGSILSPLPSLKEVVDANMIETFEYNNLPFDSLTSSLIIKNQGALIGAGDTLILLSGMHGAVEIDRHYNADYIYVIGAEGHDPVLEKLHLRSGANWDFQNFSVSSEPYGYYLNDRLVYFESHGWRGPVSDISISYCSIYSGEDGWNWTPEEWLAKYSTAIQSDGIRMRITNNMINYVDHGINAIGAEHYVAYNVISNFGGDGLRALGYNQLFEYNIVKNCFKVDDNHDDGLQSFNLDTHDVRKITVRGNIIINTEDPNQPNQGPLQGIVGFDGPYNDWVIENNIVHVNHWHGITLLGGYDCKIINNTVIDPTPDITPGATWIRVDDQKDGTPSEGCIAANNISNKMVIDGVLSNNIILADYTDYENVFEDYKNFNFRAKAGSAVIDVGMDSLAPAIDILGVSRPQGLYSDVGAYELEVSLNTSFIEIPSISVAPNPFDNLIKLASEDIMNKVELLNFSGQKLLNRTIHERSFQLNLPNLNAGLYFLRVHFENNSEIQNIKIIKK